MSYQEMDHAKWMESNNRAANKINANRRKWRVLPESLTDFQKRVCDILGMVGGGIYNAPIAIDKIDWSYGHGGVSVVWKHTLATYDFDQLTRLVFLCHAARIRCDIGPAGPHLLRLSFWQRAHEGSMARRHPDLKEAVATFEKYLPADHRVRYIESVAPDVEEVFR